VETYSWGWDLLRQKLDTAILQTVNIVLSHSELTHNYSEHTGDNDDTTVIESKVEENAEVDTTNENNPTENKSKVLE